MDFTSKLSLYDILTQLISGFLILALFIPQTTSLQENFVVITIFSYLIGIIVFPSEFNTPQSSSFFTNIFPGLFFKLVILS